MTVADLREDLINTIKWYRDEYHRKDFGHSKMIEQARQATTRDQIFNIWQVVDGWLD